MSGITLDNDGRAVIFNRKTGLTMTCAVPTAIENVRLSKGVWIHGDGTDAELIEGGEPEPAPAPDPVIPLVQEGVLPLPSAEPVVVVEPAVVAEPAPAPAAPAPLAQLDHDGDNKPGGSTPKAGRTPEEEAERTALFAEFKARDIKVFAGSTTDKLRAKLAELKALETTA